MSAVAAPLLVVTGGVVQLQPCSLYPHKHPLIEQHHVAPESWWAPQPVGSPFRALCPDCHYGTHVAIDALLAGHDVKLLRPRWVILAREAFALAKQYGLTPKPTL